MILTREIPRTLKDVEAIRELSHEFFGEEPTAILPQGFGQMNKVYEVATRREGNLIFQLNPEKKLVRKFYQGNSAMELARERGIPVPRVIATGNSLVQYAYQIYKKIEGTVATEYVEQTQKMLRELAVYAKRINQVDVPGWGKISHWQDTRREYYDSWKEYITKEFVIPLQSAWLQDSDALTAEEKVKFLDAVKEMASWDVKPKLIHGDIALKNTIVDERQNIVGIIDWDEALYGLAPDQEIAYTTLWLNESDRTQFLFGYGMTGEQYQEMLPAVRIFQILKLIEFHAWECQIQSDQAAMLKNKIRSLLNGAF